MANIRIITDSTADLPVQFIEEYDIHVVPLKVIFKEKMYREGEDITTDEFYKKLKKADQLPSTSQPSPGEFQEVYEKYTANGASVISIHISAEMSGTYQSALMARKNLSGRDIRVIDSKNVTCALGLIVIAAAKAAKEGKNPEEIEKIALDIAEKIKVYFIVDTLENLHKGGRIGRATALLGTVLKIKPVLTINNGIVAPFEKIRGKGKAINKIISILKDHSRKEKINYCVFMHAHCLKNALILKDKIRKEIGDHEGFIGEIGAVVGTHAGIGTFGIIYY